MVRTHRGQWWEWTSTAILPVESNTVDPDLDGVLAIASAGGETAERFEHFCRRFLTSESWAFILNALEYEKKVSENLNISLGFYWRDIYCNVLPMSQH